jgi:hypothetical protein
MGIADLLLEVTLGYIKKVYPSGQPLSIETTLA